MTTPSISRRSVRPWPRTRARTRSLGVERARQMARRSRFPSPRSEGFPIVVVRSPPNRQNLLICMYMCHGSQDKSSKHAYVCRPCRGMSNGKRGGGGKERRRCVARVGVVIYASNIQPSKILSTTAGCILYTYTKSEATYIGMCKYTHPRTTYLMPT